MRKISLASKKHDCPRGLFNRTPHTFGYGSLVLAIIAQAVMQFYVKSHSAEISDPRIC